jgi:hypothetical protein
MISRLQTFFQMPGLLLACLVLTACVDTMPYRSTINPSKTIKEPEPCTSEEMRVEEGDSFYCVPIPTRPNNAVFFRDDFCICKDGKAVSLGNCASFCTGRSVGEETFFANFQVGPEVSLSTLGNLHGWCTKHLPHELDGRNPKCVLEFKDDNGNVEAIDALPPAGTNSLRTLVTNRLAEDRTYVVTLMEETSGARSNSIQLVKYSQDVGFPVLGPLKNVPVNQYTCIFRTSEEDPNTGDLYWTHAYRLHFYFIPRIPPFAIPPGAGNLFCHDIFTYGMIDNEQFPRLELRPGVFNLWDLTDPRFFDTNNNRIEDITEIIAQKTKHFGGGDIPTSTKFFIPFRWPGSPTINKEAGNDNVAQTLGRYMAPWIDRNNYRSYCLNNTHYYSDVPLFRAMRDVIGVETEGIYVGVKRPEVVVGSNGSSIQGPEDIILIREQDLKRVWYYLDANMVPRAPTEENVNNVQTYFNYPLNFNSPFIMTSNQRRYWVKGAHELQGVEQGGATDNGGVSQLHPHDRKIGCVPRF